MSISHRKRATVRHRTAAVQHQLVEAQAAIANAKEMNGNLVNMVIAEHDKAAHLAQLLAFVVAEYGVKGGMAIPQAKLEQLPKTLKLREYFKAETKELVLMTVLEEDEAPAAALVGTSEPVAVIEAPAIEVVKPKLVLLK